MNQKNKPNQTQSMVSLSNHRSEQAKRVEEIFFGLAVAGTATQCMPCVALPFRAKSGLPFVAPAENGHYRMSMQCHSRMSLAGIHFGRVGSLPHQFF